MKKKLLAALTATVIGIAACVLSLMALGAACGVVWFGFRLTELLVRLAL